MKITKFLAATMAAVTIASCSEQVTDFGGNIQPGDAVLSFKVGAGGGTTYATAEEEAAVKTLTAFLSYTDGSNSPAVTKIVGTSAGIAHTLANGSYTPGTAKLYFVANKDVSATSEAEILQLVDDKKIYTNVNGTLTIDATGMTATRVVDIELQAGTVSTGTVGGTPVSGEVLLKRLAARVYANSTTTEAAIAGYKVDFSGTAAEANLFTYVGTGSGVAPDQYMIKGDGAGQYGGNEAIGYVYPSATDVTITVTHPTNTGITKTVTFKPMSNKNYKLLITPSKDETILDFSVKIEEYENGGDLNVDFDGNNAFNENFTPVDGLTFENGNLEVAFTNSNVRSFKMADLIKSYVLDDVNYSFSIEIPVTRSIGMTVVDNGDGTVSLTVPYNYSSSEIKYSMNIKIVDMKDNANVVATYQLPVLVKNNPLPEGFLVDMGSATFAAVNSRQTGNISDDIAIFNKVNEGSGATFSEKMVNYLSVNVAQYDELAGALTVTAQAKCPAGFKIPAMADYKALLANVYNAALGVGFTATNPVHYNVEKRDILESITDGNRLTVSTDYSVGIFTIKGATAPGRQAYRIFRYGVDKQLVMTTTPTVPTSSFGGVRTTEGNIGFNGNDASKTLLTEGTGAGALQVRCIKDVDANAAW